MCLNYKHTDIFTSIKTGQILGFITNLEKGVMRNLANPLHAVCMNYYSRCKKYLYLHVQWLCCS